MWEKMYERNGQDSAPVQFAELDVRPEIPETFGIRIQTSGISVEFFPNSDCSQIKTVMEVLCHAAE